MNNIKKFLLASTIAVSSLAISNSVAHAECASYTRKDSAPFVQVRAYKYQVGTTAFLALRAISHEEAGMIIGRAHDFFGDCTYSGIGIGLASGSGNMEDGVYPNDASVTWTIWGGGVDVNVARAAMFAAISASPDPAPTTTTTTTIVPSQPQEEESAPTTTSPSSTTTTVWVDENDGDVIDDYAELIINKSGSRYFIEIDSSFPSQNMLVRARIGSRRSVVWNIITNTNGYRRIITTRNLAGYSISLWMNGERYDLVTVQ
jgi:hypothetical protein